MSVKRIPWNKGKKLPPHTQEWKDKVSKKMKGIKPKNWGIDCGGIGEKNAMWKGDKVGYHCMHDWVERWKGKPKKCEMCGTETAKKFEWANIDHKYRRVLEDYIRLCTSCHRNYDYKNNI